MTAFAPCLKSVDPDKLAEEIPDLSNQTFSHKFDILSGQVVGRRICHMWYDSTSQAKTRDEKNSMEYVMLYWSDEESEDSSEDHDVLKFDLGVDLILATHTQMNFPHDMLHGT